MTSMDTNSVYTMELLDSITAFASDNWFTLLLAAAGFSILSIITFATFLSIILRYNPAEPPPSSKPSSKPTGSQTTQSPPPAPPPLPPSPFFAADHTNDKNSLPPPFIAAHHTHDNKTHLLLCASGSVATIKLPPILHALSHHPHLSIRLTLTRSATSFLSGQSPEQPPLSTLSSLPNVDGIHLDAHEWAPPWTRGAPILHIELRRWADVMAIVPLSANTLAKVAGGFADNLLTSVVRAWDTDGEVDGGRARARAKKVIVVAPAMNTAMWRHPVTAEHLRRLEDEWGTKVGGWIEVLRPIEKELACGDTGDGAMKEWQDIVRDIENRLGLYSEEEEGQNSEVS